MPVKIWTDKVDFEEGTFVGCESTDDGRLVLSAGYSTATWTSQTYYATDWVRWAMLLAECIRTVGSNIFFRFKSGTTQGECESSDWSPYFGNITADGQFAESLRAYFLNNPTATVGAYVKVEVTLES
mgnify:CR=1 FL=1